MYLLLHLLAIYSSEHWGSGCSCYPRFAGEETEVQRGDCNHPVSRSRTWCCGSFPPGNLPAGFMLLHTLWLSLLKNGLLCLFLHKHGDVDDSKCDEEPGSKGNHLLEGSWMSARVGACVCYLASVTWAGVFLVRWFEGSDTVIQAVSGVRLFQTAEAKAWRWMWVWQEQERSQENSEEASVVTLSEGWSRGRRGSQELDPAGPDRSWSSLLILVNEKGRHLRILEQGDDLM